MWWLALLPQSKNPTISRYSGFVLAFSGYSKLAAGMSTTVGSIRCLTLVKCVTYTFKLYLYIFFPHPSNHFWSREYTLEAYFKCCQQDWFFAKTLAMDKWTRHENKLFKYNYQRLSAKDESSCFIKCLKRRWCSTKTDLRRCCLHSLIKIGPVVQEQIGNINLLYSTIIIVWFKHLTIKISERT